ncbi:hypothetical protein [Falsibacillus albus]|nr:hypothetical protein [Falsibacillus albus]
MPISDGNNVNSDGEIHENDGKNRNSDEEISTCDGISSCNRSFDPL